MNRDELLDEWLLKKTEFTRYEFFEKTRKLLFAYELSETMDGNVLRFIGKTTPRIVNYYDDDGFSHSKLTTLKVCVEVEYNEKCCHTWTQIDGCGEHFGGGGPVKTFDDLSKMFIHHSEEIELRKSDFGPQGNLFEDLTLFETAPKR